MGFSLKCTLNTCTSVTLFIWISVIMTTCSWVSLANGFRKCVAFIALMCFSQVWICASIMSIQPKTHAFALLVLHENTKEYTLHNTDLSCRPLLTKDKSSMASFTTCRNNWMTNGLGASYTWRFSKNCKLWTIKSLGSLTFFYLYIRISRIKDLKNTLKYGKRMKKIPEAEFMNVPFRWA